MMETPQEFDPFSLFVEETHAKREALPPRLDVRLHIHEDVSSKAVDDPDGGAGSLSQLYIDGKVMVSYWLRVRILRPKKGLCTELSFLRRKLTHPMETHRS